MEVVGNYKIERLIAEGGMGVVYYGRHITLNREVAIKKLHLNLTNNSQFKERFINEAVLLAKLNNPYIIAVYDLVEQNNEYYIIMEFVDGAPIDEIMQKTNAPFEFERALNIFKKILVAFDYAHEQGIVHRDIKPSNIIIDSNGNPKVLDFGIAKLITANHSMTKTGTKIGSILYMSPEQVLGHDVDIRSDIYSLGILLYEMLVNRLPYDLPADTEFHIMESILKNPIRDIRQFGISESIYSVILVSTAKEKNKRFQNCQDFLFALNNENYSAEVNYDQNYYQQTVYQSQNKANTVSSSYSSTVISETPHVHSHSAQEQRSNKNRIPLMVGSVIGVILIALLIINFVGKDNTTSTTLNTKTDTKTTTGTNTTENNTYGSEVETRTNNQTTNQRENEENPRTTYDESSERDKALQTVTGFINDLGNRDFRSAYSKQNNRNWGDYSFFSSTRSFGGISSTTVEDAQIVDFNNSEATVYVDYYSYDPANRDGRYKQNFTVRKSGGEWKITKVTNISVQQW